MKRNLVMMFLVAVALCFGGQAWGSPVGLNGESVTADQGNGNDQQPPANNAPAANDPKTASAPDGEKPSQPAETSAQPDAPPANAGSSVNAPAKNEAVADDLVALLSQHHVVLSKKELLELLAREQSNLLLKARTESDELQSIADNLMFQWMQMNDILSVWNRARINLYAAASDAPVAIWAREVKDAFSLEYLYHRLILDVLVFDKLSKGEDPGSTIIFEEWTPLDCSSFEKVAELDSSNRTIEAKEVIRQCREFRSIVQDSVHDWNYYEKKLNRHLCDIFRVQKFIAQLTEKKEGAKK